MPLHRIFAPAGLFSDEDKSGLSSSITSLYTRIGLPAFYVIVVFHDLPPSNFFIGGKQVSLDKPFVRIVSQHLARTVVEPARREATTERLQDCFKPFIADKGYDWEMHIEEAPADVWRINEFKPPAPNSQGEKQWAQDNKPSPYEGETMAQYIEKQANL